MRSNISDDIIMGKFLQYEKSDKNMNEKKQKFFSFDIISFHMFYLLFSRFVD